MARFRMHALRANNILEIHRIKEFFDLDPEYQRLSIWDEEKKQLFIDSIINGVDIPKLYFHEVSQSNGRSHKYAVIDGKQRLLAVWRFMANELPLPGKFRYFDDETITAGGATYDRLLSEFPALRARFDSFDLPVILVRTDDSRFIEELFDRLNQAVPLSAAERRNAMGAPLTLSIRKIARTPFFKESVRVANNRYQHLDLAAKFLYLTRGQGFHSTKKATLDGFVTSYREARDVGDQLASRKSVEDLERATSKILERMRSFFRRSDPLLASQGRITLYFHVFRLYDKEDRAPDLTRDMLERFNADVTNARLKSQRRSRGSDEPLAGFDEELIAFDREKQSPNDGGALTRQYELAKRYFGATFKVDLLEPD